MLARSRTRDPRPGVALLHLETPRNSRASTGGQEAADRTGLLCEPGQSSPCSEALQRTWRTGALELPVGG
jgi:hypothetical protein